MKLHYVFCCLICTGILLNADEGMWLFNAFPKAHVENKYGFQVTDQFLDHLRLSSARLGAGGSGSFVSPSGLLFTNHHVAADCIQKLGSSEHDYMTNGFSASNEAEELKCPDLEVNVLERTEDVTARVKAGIQPAAAPAEANRQRKAAMTRIEQECTEKTKMRCDVVTLYSGAQYHLYEYKKYTDIRLVFAPEGDIAFFGGDPDNFTYPRYDFDLSFFRAYENGRPAIITEYLRWSHEGVKEGELALVSGHPASTSRLHTVAQLEFSRDYTLPLIVRRLESRIRALKEYSSQGTENRRIAHDKLLGAENSFKALTGELAGLRDPALMDRKRKDERELRASIARDPKQQAEFGKIWDEVAALYKQWTPDHKQYALLEAANVSDLFRIARGVLRLPQEKTKPDTQRLREYRDSALPSLEFRLYSPAPISDSLEIVLLTDYFQQLEKGLGTANQVVKSVLGNKTPRQAAENYVHTSKLKDVGERKRLAASLDAVRQSNDGMIRLVRALDEPARRVRKRYEDTVESVMTTNASKIAQARFAVFGSDEYPDATFTLRLSYGPVKGYRDKSGKPIPWATNFAGLYRHATGKEPYELPPRWAEGKALLTPDIPFNFVTTADITGGNSGSPTLNTKGEIIGIVFDGNLESLPNDFVYTDTEARAVHVAAQAIVEGLQKLYHADRVLRELGIEPETRSHTSGR